MPARVIITKGTRHDSTQASLLIEGISTEHLLADKAYESDTILLQLKQQGINPLIPPKSNRKAPWPFDKDLYNLRHLLEKAFLNLKHRRGIATRYAKNTASFLAEVHIRYLVIWGSIL